MRLTRQSSLFVHTFPSPSSLFSQDLGKPSTQRCDNSSLSASFQARRVGHSTLCLNYISIFSSVTPSKQCGESARPWSLLPLLPFWSQWSWIVVCGSIFAIEWVACYSRLRSYRALAAAPQWQLLCSLGLARAHRRGKHGPRNQLRGQHHKRRRHHALDCTMCLLASMLRHLCSAFPGHNVRQWYAGRTSRYSAGRRVTWAKRPFYGCRWCCYSRSSFLSTSSSSPSSGPAFSCPVPQRPSPARLHVSAAAISY